MAARSPRGYCDRAVASGRWLPQLRAGNIGFVLRWNKRQKLLCSWGEARTAWEIRPGKRWWAYRWLPDRHTAERHKVALLAVCDPPSLHSRCGWCLHGPLGTTSRASS